MKIIYLTWGETPRCYGVYGTQVIKQFTKIKENFTQNKYYFISAVPIIHSGFIRDGIRYLSVVKKIKKQLIGIDWYWINIYVSQNFVNCNKNTFKFLFLISTWHLKRRICKINPDIMHCRSYCAAWAALSIREKYKLKYQVVFDARGMWPEEVALKKNYGHDDTNYIFLKKVEKEIVEKSDITIAVSSEMSDHYKKIGSKKIEIVHISSDIPNSPIQKINNSINEVIKFCYVGALSTKTWHSPDELIKLFCFLTKIIGKTEFTIITNSDKKEIQKFLEIYNVKSKIISAKSSDEVILALEKQDIGILSYFNPKTETQINLSNIVLSVKFVEYISAGLPVICNKYCNGAASIIKNENLGLVYDPNDLTSISKESILHLLSEINFKNRYISYADKKFSFDSNANKYNSIYEELLKPDAI